jgi:arylsulfatase A-like enzyme
MLPNLVLVVLDTARADAVEGFGACAGATPNLAALGRAGTAAAAYSTCNWTTPSHASMFTGLLPRALGLGAGVAPAAALEQQRGRVLAEVLRARGYDTAAVSANPYVSEWGGLAIGFDRFDQIAVRRHRPGRSFRDRVQWQLEAVRARTDDGLRAVAAAVRGLLDATSPDRPFFWFVNLMECHSPYLPPRPWNDLGAIERWRAGADAARWQTHDARARVCAGELDVPPQVLARMHHLYDRSVSAMDHWVGQLVDDLDRAGRLDDTVLVVTSDHGENFGEGHLVGHLLSVDDRLIRVPLIVSGPGTGSRALPFSLVGLPALIGDLLGLEDHPWGADGSGVAVAQTDGIATWDPEARRRLEAAWRLPRSIIDRLGSPISCATDGRFKLVRDTDTIRLHDLTEDPFESRDVAAAHPHDAARLRAALDEADIRREPHDRPHVRVKSDTSTTDLEERLRLLGYL